MSSAASTSPPTKSDAFGDSMNAADKRKLALKARRQRKKMRRQTGVAVKHVMTDAEIKRSQEQKQINSAARKKRAEERQKKIAARKAAASSGNNTKGGSRRSGSARGGRGGRGRGRGRGGRGGGARSSSGRGGSRKKGGASASASKSKSTATEAGAGEKEETKEKEPAPPRFTELRSLDDVYGCIENQIEKGAEKRKQQCQTRSEEIQELITGEGKIFEHIRELELDKTRYLRVLHSIVQYKVISTVSTATKARILAALLVNGEKSTAEWLLSLDQYYGVGEVAKTLSLLDAPRKSRQLRRKYQGFLKQEAKLPGSVPNYMMAALKKDVNNAEVELHSGSLSGAKIRLFSKWLRSKDEDTLTFWLLNFPPENWHLICDLLHTSPKDFKLPFFQHAVYESYPARKLSKKDEKLLKCLKEKTKKTDLASAASEAGAASVADASADSSAPSATADTKSVDTAASGEPDAPEAGEEEKKDSSSAVTTKKKTSKLSRRELAMRLEKKLARIKAIKDAVPNPAIPEDSLAAQGKKLTNDNIIEMCGRFPYLLQCFSYVRKKIPRLGEEAKKLFVSEMPLQDVLWWYDELHCSSVERTVNEKLNEANEASEFIFDPRSPRSNYGKLMERLLACIQQRYSFVDALKPQIQRSLSGLKVSGADKIKCAVLGDKSGSMSVAVRSATIIASLMSVALSADLVFFDNGCVRPPVVPRSVDDTIKVVNKIRAQGGTSMAAGLWPYLQNKDKRDLIILVSDEGENGRCQGKYFAEMFAEYRKKICPNCRLFLVSFLQANYKGSIQRRCDAAGVEYTLFTLNPHHPDTSKFDSLLGLVSLMVGHINEPVRELAEIIAQRLSIDNQTSESLANIIWAYC